MVKICCLVGFWTLLCLFVASIYRVSREGFVYVKRLHQIPCSRCVFFTKEYCLKCTVHPLKALSEEAIDCRDFEPIS